MPNIEMFNESRWTVDDFAQIAESLTGDENVPFVFAVSLKENPLTRKQLAALHALIGEVLSRRPEQLIVGVKRDTRIATPQLVPPVQQ